jgi:multisubunit Na+/H+ antiporter MnhF subunit
MAFDTIRVFMILIYCTMIWGDIDDKAGKATILSLVNFISWISVLKYLRRLGGVRGFISLVFTAIT